MRCFGILSPRHDDRISIQLPDIGLDKEWRVADLPWSKFTAKADDNDRAPAELDQSSLSAIESFVGQDGLAAPAHSAELAILYLYMAISNGRQHRSFSFTARSALPISAGLGSSASYASCIASSLLLLNKKISLPVDVTAGALADSPILGRQALEPEQTDLINQWAFLAEKVIHGNPSGIDNAVAVRGGAVAFARAVHGNQGRLDSVKGFKSIRFLLTDTRIPRNTKALVAGVSAKLDEDPIQVGKIMQSIQNISDEAISLLSQSDLPRSKLISRISAMMDENHQHLASLGVSHPALEAIRAKTSAQPYGLSTKLTGAGGGGCAVTLIPDEFDDNKLADLVNDLQNDGFRPYLTSVGGSGLGIMHTKAEAVDGQASESGEPVHVPLQKIFQDVDAEALEKWAEHTGEWLFT